MRFSLSLIVAASAALLVSASPAPSQNNNSGKVPIHRAKGRRIKGSYIITLKDSADVNVHIAAVEKLNGSKATHTRWNSNVYNGYAGTMTDDVIEKLRSDPNVLAIEEDAIVRTYAVTTQTNAPWGLQRLSQKSKTVNQNPAALNFSYLYDTRAGNGTDIYVIDTGINTAHQDFGGRAFWGATFGGYANKDTDGHGTHVAGSAVGTRYGVAKLARTYAVKALGDDGSGSMSDVISGITWSVTRAQTSRRPSIINLSIGVDASDALDRAVNGAVDRGVHVVAAAGNENDDAKKYSPGRADKVVCVGATTIGDTRADFSNYGSVVDIYAPGEDITSTWIGSTTAIQTISGTSMASPQIAGLIAYYISVYGNTTPALMRTKLQAQAINGVIRGLSSTTKNALANNANGRA